MKVSYVLLHTSITMALGWEMNDEILYVGTIEGIRWNGEPWERVVRSEHVELMLKRDGMWDKPFAELIARIWYMMPIRKPRRPQWYDGLPWQTQEAIESEEKRKGKMTEEQLEEELYFTNHYPTLGDRSYALLAFLQKYGRHPVKSQFLIAREKEKQQELEHDPYTGREKWEDEDLYEDDD